MYLTSRKKNKQKLFKIARQVQYRMRAIVGSENGKLEESVLSSERFAEHCRPPSACCKERSGGFCAWLCLDLQTGDLESGLQTVTLWREYLSAKCSFRTQVHTRNYTRSLTRKMYLLNFFRIMQPKHFIPFLLYLLIVLTITFTFILIECTFVHIYTIPIPVYEFEFSEFS